VLPGRILGSVAVGGGSVWVTNDDYVGRVFELDARSGTLTRTIALGGLATGVATSPGAVWVTLADRDLLVRIDPSTGRVVARVRVGVDPSAVVTAGGRVFTANDNGGSVSEVDVRSNRVIERAIRVGPRAIALAATATRVYVVSDPRHLAIVAFDIAHPSRMTRIRLPSRPLALAPIGRRLAIVSPKGLIVLRR
jgi:DNA-binding beta-propeller fold protein YncE